MKSLVILLVFLFGCNIPEYLPKETEESTPISTPTTTPTSTPTTRPDVKEESDYPFRPCILVEETTFDKNTDKSVWKPSYYYNTPESYPLEFTSEGISLKGSSGYRSGVTLFPIERDLSDCPEIAIRVVGTIKKQSLGGSGYDDREAPIAVMIQYTDMNGVRHNSLNAFNEGEQDDRSTTRMFWHGFGYLEPTNNFGYNFTPSLTAVEKDVKFDKTIDFPIKVKLIHSITIEGSGWALESIVHGFTMKPKAAFENPNAPYKNMPNKFSIIGNWEAIHPTSHNCKMYLSFVDDGRFDFSAGCNPFDDTSSIYVYGEYEAHGSTVDLEATEIGHNYHGSFLFSVNTKEYLMITKLSEKQILVQNTQTSQTVVFTKH